MIQSFGAKAYIYRVLSTLTRGAGSTFAKLTAFTAEAKNIVLHRPPQREDGGELLLTGSGFEIELTDFLMSPAGKLIVNKYIQGKRALVVPGYGSSAFILKQLGASEVVGIDADEVTIAWLKAIAQTFACYPIGSIIMGSAVYPTMATLSNVMDEFSLRNPAEMRQCLIDRVQRYTREKYHCPIDGVSFVKGFLGGDK